MKMLRLESDDSGIVFVISVLWIVLDQTALNSSAPWIQVFGPETGMQLIVL